MAIETGTCFAPGRAPLAEPQTGLSIGLGPSRWHSCRAPALWGCTAAPRMLSHRMPNILAVLEHREVSIARVSGERLDHGRVCVAQVEERRCEAEPAREHHRLLA